MPFDKYPQCKALLKYILVTSGLNCKQLLHYFPLKMRYSRITCQDCYQKQLPKKFVNNSDETLINFTVYQSVFETTTKQRIFLAFR